jgi:hypothetical protein
MQTGLSSTVYALDVDSADNVYAGGFFQNAGGIAAADRFAKWNGSAWSAVGGVVDSTVFGIDIDSSDNIYIAGQFVTTNGVSTRRIAKWNGTQWSGFGVGSVGLFYLRTVAVGSSENIYVGGLFTNMKNENKPAFSQFSKNSVSETPQ